MVIVIATHTPHHPPYTLSIIHPSKSIATATGTTDHRPIYQPSISTNNLITPSPTLITHPSLLLRPLSSTTHLSRSRSSTKRMLLDHSKWRERALAMKSSRERKKCMHRSMVLVGSWEEGQT